MEQIKIKVINGGLVVEADDPSDKERWVSCKRLAAEMKMDRSACRRLLLRSGVNPVMKRLPDSGFQTALAVKRDDADRLIRVRKEEGYL